MEAGELKRAVMGRLVVSLSVLAAILFGTAGTFSYWEAWAFMGSLFTPMIVAFVVFLHRDPGLLERRLQSREELSTGDLS